MGHHCIICLSELWDLCWVPEEEITVRICHLFCMSVCLPLFTWSTYYAFSACAEKRFLSLFALCVICQSVKTLTNMPDNTNRMLHHVSTLYHSVVRHVLAVNLILDIIGCVGCRVKCRLQNVNWLETMRARSELEESFAALWLPLGCFRAPSVGKPATLAYQLLELYCSLWTKHSVSAIRQSKPF